MNLKTLIFLFSIFLAVCPAFGDEPRYNIPIAGSPQQGPSDAPVTIIEFIDFQ